MTDPDRHEQKKAARRARRESERQAEFALDALTDQAIDRALELAPIVTAATQRSDQDQALDVEFPSIDEARYARKRINDALRAAEWLDVVQVWVWERQRHQRAPKTEGGRTAGFELRIEPTINV